MRGLGKRLIFISTRALALLLWIFTVVGGLVEIYLIRQIALRLYAYFGSHYFTGVTLANFIVLALGILWVAFAIVTAEYHRTRAGQPASWRLFSTTIAVELAILALYFLV